jgi:tryptophan synthase alpha chain
MTQKPIVVGFGISNGSQAAEAARLADGVAVGSAFVKIMSESHSIPKRLENLKKLSQEISNAIHNKELTEEDKI